MSEHFIKNIEIKNFKCFKDFKAEGFGRVNLIGGKNNVGKTAFMEACLLSKSEDTKWLFRRLLEIQTHRDVINNLLLKTTREEDLQKLIKDNLDLYIILEKKEGEDWDAYDDREIYSRNVWEKGIIKIERDTKINIFTKDTKLNYISYYGSEEEYKGDLPDTYTLSELVDFLDISFHSTKKAYSLNFISPYSNSNEELENIIGQSKLDDKYDALNKYLLDVFNVSSIDIIKNKPMLRVGNEYRELSYFGQGIKTFINIISSILLLEDDVIFIDEIENGIHYTNLDKLWEIIFTISKQQKVQVFATTHSKECIESYARVAKKLEDEEITFIELGKNKEDELKAMVYSYNWFIDEVEQNHEVRGW